MTAQEIYEKVMAAGNNKLIKAWTIKDILINSLADMFEYKNLPDSVKQEFIEQYYIINGSCPMWILDDPNAVRYKGEPIVSIGCDAEAPDAYGIGKNYIASTFSGYVKTLEDGVDCCVGRNNSLYTSDMNVIDMCADMLTEIFTSLKTNVLYSRLKPIFKVSNDTEKAAVIEAFKGIKNDLEPIQVTSKNVLSQIEGEETVKVLDITDVKNADKIQYIIKAADDVIRWFYTLYGQAIQGNSKLAQQTVDEVKGNTSTSFILPNDRLRMRRQWVERCNNMFGLNIEVDFSDSWKTESIKYKAEADINENGQLEELDDIGKDTGDAKELPEEVTEETEEVKDNEETISD